MLTLEELSAKMVLHWDVEQILEILQITSEELVDRFDDRVATHYDKIHEELGQ